MQIENSNINHATSSRNTFVKNFEDYLKKFQDIFTFLFEHYTKFVDVFGIVLEKVHHKLEKNSKCKKRV